MTASLKQHGDYVLSLDDQGLIRASDVAFVSMHINEQVQQPLDMQNMQMHDGETLINKDSAPAGHMGVFAQKNYFSPHWSMDVIEKALEAYCKIDGVPTDVLISGIPAQNRAVLLSEARVLRLGPRFMSIYIQKLAPNKFFDFG